MSTHHAPPDSTPAALCAILHGFAELNPISQQSGPVSLILNDHAMDEHWLEVTQKGLLESLRDPENTETNLSVYRAEYGLVTLLLGLPEDMRLGQGRWASIPPPEVWAAGGGHPEGEGTAEAHGENVAAAAAA